MKTKLLSLGEKRRLLQRMARAVREGVALDAFCATENIGMETLFEYLTEMRALETKGINPFLPDVSHKKLTKMDKILALEAMTAYKKKTGVGRVTLCRLAGISSKQFDVFRYVQ